MGIKEDFLKFTDKNGLVQPNTLGGSGNGVLYTAEAVVVLSDNLALDVDLWGKYRTGIEACERHGDGLMYREAVGGNNDQEGPDDYHGAALASLFLDDGKLAQRIVAYGRQGVTKWDAQYEDASKLKLSRFVYLLLSLGGLKRVKWVYNNPHPGYFTLSAWLGRMPGLIAAIKLAAGETPTPLEYFAWIVGIFIMLFKKQPDTDAFILPWCSMRIASKKSFILKPFVALGMWRLRKVWGSFQKLILHYFNNPTHPTGVYSKE